MDDTKDKALFLHSGGGKIKAVISQKMTHFLRDVFPLFSCNPDTRLPFLSSPHPLIPCPEAFILFLLSVQITGFVHPSVSLFFCFSVCRRPRYRFDLLTLIFLIFKDWRTSAMPLISMYNDPRLFTPFFCPSGDS